MLINDCSKDNSKKIIENLKNKDSRIIIINNNKNMGTLYSRNIGVLSAKGKYIFPLDNDDMFFNENIFENIYNEGKYYNHDIIGFKAICGKSYKAKINDMFEDPFINNKNKIIVHQPQLGLLSLINNDCHIWGKSIKAVLYKSAVNALGANRYSVYLCYAEDDVMVFILYSLANSFKFIPKYGLFHLISGKSASFYLPKSHILFSKIFFLDILYDFTKNNYKDKQYVISNALKLKKVFLSKIKIDKNNKIYLQKVINKIIKCNFVSISNKKKLLKIFNFTY